jgi:hypothetical protein
MKRATEKNVRRGYCPDDDDLAAELAALEDDVRAAIRALEDQTNDDQPESE